MNNGPNVHQQQTRPNHKKEDNQTLQAIADGQLGSYRMNQTEKPFNRGEIKSATINSQNTMTIRTKNYRAAEGIKTYLSNPDNQPIKIGTVTINPLPKNEIQIHLDGPTVTIKSETTQTLIEHEKLDTLDQPKNN